MQNPSARARHSEAAAARRTKASELYRVYAPVLSRAHLIPSRSVEVETEHRVVRVQFPAEFLKEGPRYNPKPELSDLEKQGINAYYGHFVPLRRTSAIEELRPEQALPPKAVTAARTAPQDRATIEREEQAFFNQEGFVTDAMPEANAAEELERTIKEAKPREKE